MTAAGSDSVNRRRRMANAVPGAMTWTILIAAVVGVLAFPGYWLAIVAGFLAWFTARTALTFVGVFLGEWRIRTWSRVDWTAHEDEPSPQTGIVPSAVRHVVLVPNLNEPVEVLERTLGALAAQHRASERLIVVLAMEQREPGAEPKAAGIIARHDGEFLSIFATMHPSDLPGEARVKASNLTWAARRVSERLAALGVDPDLTTVTACDSDSVIHPSYFAALSRLYAGDPGRFHRFWQAPMRYYGNLRQVPFWLRLDLVVLHNAQLGDLTMPSPGALPMSTYSLSLRLAEQSGWWDPAIVSEDWHVFLRSFVSTGGHVEMVPIYLPFTADIVHEPTAGATLKARYNQLVRHGWGAEDVGYLLTELPRSQVKWTDGLLMTSYVLQDHVSRAVAFVVLTSGSLLVWEVASTHNIMLLWFWWQIGWLVTALYVALTVLFVGTIALEAYRRAGVGGRWSVLAAETVATWALLPVIGIAAGTVPAMHAQTKLMLGSPLVWKVAPKRPVRKPPSAPSRRGRIAEAAPDRRG